MIAVLQFAVPALPALGIGTSIGDQSAFSQRAPEQPLGIAFSIWGVIFTAYALFALYAIRHDEPLSRRMAPPLALAGALNVLWMLQAQLHGGAVAGYLLLFPIIAAAWWASRTFDRMRGTSPGIATLLAASTAGLLSGWLAAAAGVAGPSALRTLLGQGPTDAVWPHAAFALGTAALLAGLYSLRVSRGLWFYLALCWGLVMVGLNAWFETQTPLIGAAAFATAAALVLLRWKGPAPGAGGRGDRLEAAPEVAPAPAPQLSSPSDS